MFTGVVSCVRKDSNWHQQITHFPEIQVNGFIPDSKKITNFCSYTRWFLWKLLIVIPATVIIVGSFSGWYLATFIAFLTPSISYATQGAGYQIWCQFHVSLAVLGLLCYTKYRFDIWNDKRKNSRELRELEEKYESGELERPPHGFLKLWYLSFKEKYCPKMEY